MIQLPKGATPIDFAFAVHTEIGQHCAGREVNGRIAPLLAPAANSETVEILTSPTARPTRDWLSHVRTGRARHKIRQWLKHEEQQSATKLGQDILDREVKRRRLPRPSGEQLARGVEGAQPERRDAPAGVDRAGRRADRVGAQADLP